MIDDMYTLFSFLIISERIISIMISINKKYKSLLNFLTTGFLHMTYTLA